MGQREGALVVVGNRGRGGFTSLLLGSVSQHVATHAPCLPLWSPGMPSDYHPDYRHAAERRRLRESLAPGRDKFPYVSVEALVVHGDPARVLVGASHTAQLLVVGGRGFGCYAGTVLGSVSLKLLHHADCPVLIART